MLPPVLGKCPVYMQLSVDFEKNDRLAQSLIDDMRVAEDFLSEADEKTMLQEVEPYMRTLHYEFDHWDDVSWPLNPFEKLSPLAFRQSTATEKRNASTGTRKTRKFWIESAVSLSLQTPPP